MSPPEQNLQAQIPVIDISNDNPEAPRQLLDAAIKFGFIYIANDKGEIDPDLIAAMFDLTQKFFASPLEVKQSVSINSNKAGKNHGWLSQGVEKLDPATQKRPDIKEAFNMAEPLSSLPQQPLTPLLTQHLPTLLSFHTSCRALCARILRTFAVALEIHPVSWFASRHDPSLGPSGSVLRMLYYPQRPPTTPSKDNDDEMEDLRAGAHSDFGSITCLFQLPGQPGLEILTPEGQWAGVAVDPLGAMTETEGKRNLPMLVNIGDLLQEWTGGLLKSTRHRVVFSPSQPPPEQSGSAAAGNGEKDAGTGTGAGDRYSLAYFCHPCDDAVLEPVPSRLVREHVAAKADSDERGSGKGEEGGGVEGEGRRTITAKEHLQRRLMETYTI